MNQNLAVLKTKMLLAALIGAALTSCSGEVETGFSGRYVAEVETYDLAEGEASSAAGAEPKPLSQLTITKHEHGYAAQGVIWAGNHHVCHIASPNEGEEGPLLLNRIGNTLSFVSKEPDYNIDCALTLTLEGKTLTLSDPNHHCANYLFSCGVNVRLDEQYLTKIDEDEKS
jgi:hypothetical protein